MRDHIGERKRVSRTKQFVGVRELKTHAARILRHVRQAHASYVVTHRGKAVGVILPVDSGEDTSPAADDQTDGAAWDAFLRAGRRLEPRFHPGVSGVRQLAAMRR
jgi:prevent-host-death family protein